jgi:hypothetical protein
VLIRKMPLAAEKKGGVIYQEKELHMLPKE